jgi:two-component system, NarL family, nitrate/nitrite response regulator NarL
LQDGRYSDTEAHAVEQRSIGTVLIGANALLREGLAHILDGAHFEILASASYLDASIATSLPHHQTVLLIIEASGDTDLTIRQIESFKERCPAGRVVVLAHHLQLPEMVMAYTAGANAYLISVATSDVFIKSLELVMLGETILPPSLLTLLYTNENTSDDGNDKLDQQDSSKQDPEDLHTNGKDDPSNDNDSDEDLEAIEGTLPRVQTTGAPRLSARQRLILRYLIEGDPNKTIARKIHITEATVKVHVKAILRKIRVHNRTQAAIWAMNNGSFIPEGQNDSSAKLLGPPPQNLVTENLVAEQVPPPSQNGALPSTKDFKIEGADHGPSADNDHIIQKSIHRKQD